MHLLVASDGRLWDVNAAALRRHLGYYGGSGDLVRLATGDLGYAFIVLTADRARLRLRPAMFTRACFEAVAGVLVKQNPRRVVIEIEDDQTVAQLFDTIYDTIAHLDQLRVRAPGEDERPDFFHDVLALERIRSPRREPLLKHYRSWQRARGELDAQRLQMMNDQPTAAKQLFARVTASDKVVPITWPSYMTLYAPSEVPKIIGKPFDEHVDGGYLQAAAGGYVEVKRRNQPMLELVEAALRPPNGPPRRIRYERLLLPWRGVGGEMFVSSVSFFRSQRLLDR
jgi:hypothetical protein